MRVVNNKDIRAIFNQERPLLSKSLFEGDNIVP